MEQIRQQLQPRLDAISRFIQDRLPAHRNDRILLGAGIGAISTAVLFPLAYHHYQGRQLTHTYPSSGSRYASVECGEISSFPQDLIDNHKQYQIAHDKVTKGMPDFSITLSPKHERLFTEVVRWNMLKFSGTPQGLFLWFAAGPVQRKTFTEDYINSLGFQEGDVVCGVYQVVKRTPLRIELALNTPKESQPLSGLTVISIRPRGEGSVLVSETVQWVKKDTGTVLPLQRWLPRFLHSIVSRYLILSGAAHLQEVFQDV
ncbi:hypothetical protein DOTSEDRAFT_73126 [Dothistroma septosporum NZE10]|uniref:Uncharacterized protein n=1 Tax=Dothistroma septosporum (strain NZE10 / CBS 128990) TaxID=675120 RepID=N1PJC6_DOTSN|nr:hypothetical protein DOTSEDRAFT_73126 [Dothistroma septosporum NZE10]